MNYFYVTTPIYYVNDIPHIGHAYTNIASDVLARFKRLKGDEVYFLTGTDEHGQKIQKAAEAKDTEPQAFTDIMSQRFFEMTAAFNLTNNDFIRTTEERHKIAARNLWQKLMDNGFIYLGKYAGWYAVRDECFYAENEIIEGKAPTGAPVEWVEEPSYFFKLSYFQDKLLKFYEENPNFIVPKHRYNEVISFVKSGLSDISVSRTSFEWGIKVPNDENHVMYVWLDALTNYISALGYPENTQYMNNFWPTARHIVGKDILRFHAIFWPAFLMAARLPLPAQVIAHGWWLNEGQKMSKSLGNVINPYKLVEEFGLDQMRYYMMREIPFGSDGNYSKNSMIARANNELANNIGNLVQRTISFIHKNCESLIPENKLGENKRDENISKYLEIYLEKMDNYKFSEALENILELASFANVYIDREAPWTLKKNNIEKMEFVLYNLTEMIRCISIMLLPFIPDSANKILDIIGVDEEKRKFKYLYENIEYNKLPELKLIFKKYDQTEMELTDKNI